VELSLVSVYAYNIIFFSFFCHINRPTVHPYASEYAQTKQYQSDVSNYLAVQKEHVLASVRASERLIQATMQSQYHLFKPKYLLLLEGIIFLCSYCFCSGGCILSNF